MQNLPIGIFDSGIGGLTVVKEIMRQLPSESLVYFGDTARVPYGTKSRKTVTDFSGQILDFLLTKKIKAVIVACNTASSFALPLLRRKTKIPVMGVIEPGAEEAIETSASGRIGVIGTAGTIKSNSYPLTILKLAGGMRKRVQIFSVPCPLFVPLIEEGWNASGDRRKIVKSVAEKYLSPLRGRNIDTLILGCTHYPLIKDVIIEVLDRGINIIDSARATAVKAKSLLLCKNLLSKNKKPSYNFYVSDAPDRFVMAGERFLGRKIESVKEIDIEKFHGAGGSGGAGVP
ncbi:MAG: glutamate racemase [Elusimicrobia bacterium]|nr:glutamate racemase [Elusimicrobiota bacterium]